ncbi:MAG: HAMP domain-containing sensor histidine kinase [Chloroflexota bacterium]
MKTLTLRTRIFLSYLLLIGTAVVAIIIIANRQIVAASEDAYYSNFEEKAGIIIDEMIEVWENQADDVPLDEEAIYVAVRELAEDLNITVTLLDVDSLEVIFDSRLEDIDDELYDEPDIVHLLEEEEPINHENDRDGQVYRADFVYFDNEPVLIVRVGESWQPLVQTMRTQTIALSAGLIGTGLIALLVFGSWLANALTKPLTQLRQTAQQMAAGNLDTRASTNAPGEVATLAHDFNAMAEAVENMVAQQKAFASNAAHELRTPLTAIILRTETLLEDNPDPALTQQYITEIDAEAQRLNRLVEDLRLLSRLDANKLVLSRDQVDVGQVAQHLARTFQPQIKEKGLIYSTVVNTDMPYVQASVTHIQIVLRNLIENAIKYTPEQGAITVSVVAIGGNIQVTVQDNGIGVEKAHLSHLFNRFYRVDKARNRAIPGTGLGLSLVQSIVSLYGGTISISSEGIGHGTTVLLTLPQMGFKK